MTIKLTPQGRNEQLTATKQGDKLTINGTDYDFTDLPDGATLPAEAIDCEYIIGDVGRIGGDIHLTLLLPHGSNAPEETRFPKPLTNLADGPLPLPPYGGTA